jgi:hypothetical protein
LQYENPQVLLGFMMQLSPAEIETEMRLLAPYDDFTMTSMQSSSMNHIQQFMHQLSQLLSEKKNFEILHAYLHCFLSIHGSKLIHTNGQLQPALVELTEAVRMTNKDLQLLLQVCLCLVKSALNLHIL